MAGVYDPDRPNENQWIDNNLDNDDADDTTTLPPENPSRAPTQDPSYDSIEAIESRLRALRDGLDYIEIPYPVNRESFDPEKVQELIAQKKRFLRARFPGVDFEKLGTIKIGTKYPTRLVVMGSRGGESPIFTAKGDGFMKSFLTAKQVALGEGAEQIIAKLNAQKRDFMKQMQAAAENIEMEDLGLKRKKAELKTLDDKLAKGVARVEQMENDDDDEDSTTPLIERKQQIEEQKKLNENYRRDRDKLQAEIAQQSKTQAQEKAKEAELQTQISASENTRETLEARLNATKSLDELLEHDTELERKNTEDQQILDDENATSSEKETARERIAERNEERDRLNPQIQEREEALPLRERVKRIFKKYGWTLQAVALAVGVVLSALALAGLNGLKADTKAVGQGVKAIGKKLGSLLPGLDCELYLQSRWPGFLLPGGARLAAHTCRGGLLHGKAAQEEA